MGQLVTLLSGSGPGQLVLDHIMNPGLPINEDVIIDIAVSSQVMNLFLGDNVKWKRDELVAEYSTIKFLDLPQAWVPCLF